MIKFHKYHGAGNDFIMINNLKGDIILEPNFIKLLCDRHLGIGADGLILVEASHKADCFMNYFNADGTTAEMCGNGIRCVAKFFQEQTKSKTQQLNIDTRTGIKNLKKNKDKTYSVNMGLPVFNHIDFPMSKIKTDGLSLECVSMGNPHAVIILKKLEYFNINEIGPAIENDFHFPNKINVEFVKKIDNTNYKVRVWERGCGETLACGTGACAVYAILQKSFPEPGSGRGEITLEFPGGKLYLSQNHEGEIILRGPATFVFKGEI